LATITALRNRIIYSFEEFEHVQVRSGTFTVVMALLALSWLNSPWGDTWSYSWTTPLNFSFETLSSTKPLGFWVSHVLMALFFMVLGLELKRILRVGELKAWRDAAFPAAAALGGMLVPAGIYLYLNPDDYQAGWSVVATSDVAAVLALLALAGGFLPVALRVFLSSTAIFQGIGTLLLTVILYASIQNLLALSIATGIFGLLVVLRALRNRSMWLYLLLGLAMLAGFVVAGITGAVAGVLLAFVIPVHSRVAEEDFITKSETVLQQLNALQMMKRPEPGEEMEEDYQAAVHTLRVNCNQALSPLRRLQQQLLPWAGYFVLPLFALAFAPFAYNSFEWQDLFGTVPMGIALGLVLGKPLGMLLFAWLAAVLRLARIPAGLRWGQLTGAALLAGAGFLLSLFQAHTVFADTALLTLVKISVYLASAVSALLGILLLTVVGKTKGP
jgi:Na+:H+ antiporter, NhaA family